MTPVTLMICSASAFVVGVAVVLFNMMLMMRGGKPSGIWFLVHALFGILCACASTGLVGGFIWFLVDKYAG